MDFLNIKALSVHTRIGVHAWEQCIDQLLLIDISIPCDFSACTDNLQDTIDYDAICQSVTDFVQSRAFQLIETVANQIIQLLQDRFNIRQLSVSVSKPQAIKNAGMIQVTRSIG